VNRESEKGQTVMQLVMQVHRRDEQYDGTLTRAGDECSLPFTSLLELIAVLERLTTPEPEPVEPPQARQS
jgi:hypothetical protein